MDVSPPALVIEHGHRREARLGDRHPGLAAVIVVAGIANREGAQEGERIGAAAVARVDADEGDLPALSERGSLKSAELGAARLTPGRPLVDHDGAPAQGSEPRLQRRQPAGQDLARLSVQRRQRAGRVRQAQAHLRDRQPRWLGRGRGACQLDHADDQQGKQGEHACCDRDARLGHAAKGCQIGAPFNRAATCYILEGRQGRVAPSARESVRLPHRAF